MLDVLNESIDQGDAKACLRVDGQKVVKSQKLKCLSENLFYMAIPLL